MINHPPAPRIETKVKAATAGAITSGMVLWALSEYVFAAQNVPAPVEAFVVLITTGLVTFLAGVWADHTARPDLPMSER